MRCSFGSRATKNFTRGLVESVEVSVCSHGVRQTGDLEESPNMRVVVVEVGNCCLNHRPASADPVHACANSTQSRPLSFSFPHVFVLVSCYSCVLLVLLSALLCDMCSCLVCKSERCNMQTHRRHAKQIDALTHDHIATFMCQAILSPGVFLELIVLLRAMVFVLVVNIVLCSILLCNIDFVTQPLWNKNGGVSKRDFSGFDRHLDAT